jgi:hypothetical protein
VSVVAQGLSTPASPRTLKRARYFTRFATSFSVAMSATIRVKSI